jgi:hypothetical protein
MRLGVLGMAALALVQCSHGPTAARPQSPKVEWYIACRQPLTYCPVGFEPPLHTGTRKGADYVYLADGQTRFYLPPHLPVAREQALQLRRASLSQDAVFRDGSIGVANWVGATILRLGLTAAVVTASIGVKPTESTFKDIWSE